ncbi:methyltransferase [Bacillus weihaiensis]|uniref:Methyltransferase n=1 Tax=Bacillus weihaiensis TaxID=1547283 RepID=A0A1L3MTI5_9BACI|nr:methyltransferase [Bacillus weihaiensis]
MYVYREASVYDHPQFFEDFLNRRNRDNSPNNVIEGPIVHQLIGNIKDKTILDLGCGDGRFGNELLSRGCTSYRGIDGSENMVRVAKDHVSELGGEIQLASLQTIDLKQRQYDLVVSRLVFHYLQDLKTVFRNVYYSLKDDGKFVFSVQHPLLLSSTKSAEALGKKTAWLVDDYFQSGERIEPWIGKNVVKYHRTIEEYFQLLKQAGFTIHDIREGTPSPDFFEDKQEYERRMRIPLFLLFSCGK